MKKYALAAALLALVFGSSTADAQQHRGGYHVGPPMMCAFVPQFGRVMCAPMPQRHRVIHRNYGGGHQRFGDRIRESRPAYRVVRPGFAVRGAYSR